jgi:hypothetical protein
MTYLLVLYSVMNVNANVSDVKWKLEQHVSLLFYKPTMFHTCTHDKEPCYIYKAFQNVLRDYKHL